MSGLGKYVWTALAIAVLTHVVALYGYPRLVMHVAMDRITGAHANAWRQTPRVTEQSRTIVRPSPDLAYSACVYDLSQGPVEIRVAPWRSYWSLSLYQDNSDNFFVIDDREAHAGADILIVQQGSSPPNQTTAQVVESPSTRGIALIRRLAPVLDDYSEATQVAHDDVCATLVRSAN